MDKTKLTTVRESSKKLDSSIACVCLCGRFSAFLWEFSLCLCFDHKNNGVPEKYYSCIV